MVGSVSVHWRVVGPTAVEPTKSSCFPKLCDNMLPLFLARVRAAAPALVMLVAWQEARTTGAILLRVLRIVLFVNFGGGKVVGSFQKVRRVAYYCAKRTAGTEWDPSYGLGIE